MFPGFNNTIDLPWTMSFVVRKRKQIDSFRELPKEKRPPTIMTWWGTPEEIDVWFDRVFDRKSSEQDDEIFLDESEIG